ncbi:MAG: PspC domain-containing protein [Anaerolineales bacterium]|nr:PspC domain-containing protein [Anaerolineales bacterium]MCB8954005.1 PspC domain-containing protein [Ardenticatenales bacterium]
MKGKMIRSKDDRMILGVAGGLGNYFNIDPVFIRIGFVLLTLASLGKGALLYLLLALVMPEEGAPVAKAQPFDEEEIIINDAV